jgi:hypothetical protein
MNKIAIFVEGNTELIFVREYLRKRFGFEDLEIECRKRQFGRFDEVPFSVRGTNPKYHFRIVDSGSDVKVLDDILQDEQLLYNLGYQKIIGLRDMYSESYIKIVKQSKVIKADINQKFIDGSQSRINREAKKPDSINFCFAIMELEAWLLAITGIWEKKGISKQMIYKELGYDLSKIDPEITFFHPAREVEKILAIAEKNYGKHAKEIESLVGKITKQDFEDLRNSQKCSSFREFTSSLTIT